MAIIISFTFSLIITNFIFFFSQFSFAIDTITHSHPLIDGNTLVSSDGTFELGFFTPGTTSTNRYVGIWYKNIPQKTVVWVANRENPTNEKSSMLAIDTQGNLVLVTQNNSVLWSTNSTKTTTSTIVKLLDSGNLVLRYEKHDDSDENYIWQSFDYPSDTFLPGMKIGWDQKKNLNRRLTAWKNWDDPSPGDFIFGFILTNNPEVVLWIGSTEFYRAGPFDGVRFNGAPSLEHNPIFDFEYVNNEKEVYFTYRVKNKSMIARLVMNQTIHSRQSLRWIAEERVWKMFYSVPVDYCDSYNLCGPFGNCAMDQSPLCHCLEGFEPKSKESWIMMDWTQGCVRSGNWTCGEKNRDGFLKFSNMKAPDTKKSWVNRSMNLEECRVKCLEDCNCSAYANTNIEEGSGCAIWFGDLIDLRRISNAGQDVYIRVVASEIGKSQDGRKKKVVMVVTATVSFILLILLTLVYTYWIKRTRERITVKEEYEEDQQEDLELPFFDLATIACATNGFSSDKKLGEGGFGPVYRGTLSDGQEIAVKRLSRISSQGLDEFKNEVILCAKLQHRNLVKILGCCIQGEEKLLVYEFMPNKSLDYFLFDPFKSKLLNWPKRFNIICGIARGLLYLHQDSRLRIIHRDLKASNILLDNELSPKISDFGLARIFGADQVEGNYTNKVVGTYGYMAPEYAIDGLFSTKSDVFSFGVSLLEILSGKKNRGLSHPKKMENLVSYAWRLWKEGIPLQLLDTCLGESYVVSQVLRCIHIGLLCVQQCPVDRPTMGFVVGMLTSESAMNQPKEPAFLMEKDSIFEEYSSSKQQPSSTNNISMSILEAR